jgi:threonine dehydratase
MITTDEIFAARARIRGVANVTPVLACRDLLLKAESFQPIGSFKIRGAYNMTAQIPDAIRAKGIITYSSGNHAQGVAYAARAFGIKAVIVMPSNAPPVKVTATKALGAEIVVTGAASEERRELAMELAQEHGYTVVPPFDHPHIIQGQATCGAEILEQVTDVDLILAPVGGGGLLGGIAATAKMLGANIRVIGAEPALAGDAAESFRAGAIVGWDADMVTRTIADGLRTQAIGKNSYEHIQAYVDDVLTVTEDEILAAMRILALEGRLIAEPSGAVAAAAWFFHREQLGAALHPVAVVSGGNVEPQMLRAALA